jgi:hypothetical protein
MANFSTHLGGGVFVIATAALVVYHFNLTDVLTLQGLMLIGITASLLPDIDAPQSKPARLIFFF